MSGIANVKGRQIVDSRGNWRLRRNDMAATVAKLTKHELKEIIESTVEQKLLGDPDQGLVLKKTVKDRLLRQRKSVASGQRGESLAVLVKRLGPG